MGQNIVVQHTPREPRGRKHVLALYGLALTALLILTGPQPGPWFDEFWTRFFSDPSVGLWTAFSQRWIADVHPPLFSFLQWLSAHIDRLPLEQARLLNLIPLALATIYFVLVAKVEPRARAFIAILSISIGSCAFCVGYFTELRSYFTGLCAFAALTVTLAVQDRRMREGVRANSLLLWCGFAVTLAVCLNIHYLTAAMTIVLVAIFGIAAAVGGDRRRFVIYLASGTLACVPLVAFFLYQRDMIELITKDYWLKTSFVMSASMIAGAIASPVWGVQGLLALVWVAAIVLLLRSKEKPRIHPITVILLLAVIAEILLLLAYAWATSAMIERYLIPLSVLSAALLSSALSRRIYETPWLLAIFATMSLASAVMASLPHWNDPRWDEAARYLSTRQKSCPGARIVPMQQNLSDHTPNTVENYNEAYGYMAQKWGLTLGNVDEPSPRPATECPDYYWADHFFAAGKSTDALLAQFSARFPGLNGCKVEVTTFAALSAVFAVSGDPPQCRR